MILSSDEIRSKSFNVDRKGYNRDQVDEFMKRVSDTVSQLVETERSLRTELESAASGASESTSAPPSSSTGTDADTDDLEAVGDEVTAVLRAARDSAEKMRSTAEAEAAEIRREAEAFAAEHRHEAEAAAVVVRTEAEVAARTLRDEADQDRSKASSVLSDAEETASRLRADADERATKVVADAEARAAVLVDEATRRADEKYRDAIAEAQQRLTDARDAEQQVLAALTAAHSDVGMAISRLDHGSAPERPSESKLPLDDVADGDSNGAPRTVPKAGDPVEAQPPPPAEDDSDPVRTSRQVTGGLAESLRERAGVSGPVGALFGLTADDDEAPSEPLPSEPETIDLRDKPEAVIGLGESDDPLADLVKQAVGKAVDEAGDDQTRPKKPDPFEGDAPSRDD